MQAFIAFNQIKWVNVFDLSNDCLTGARFRIPPSLVD